ncbi:gastrokine-1 isoform X2 [Anolis carolinensis]|uniref:gastrokine-1 isoform X2 n=1 Tax=Anolis carolinensis TaxID=28377 RepID=UPI002F2B3F09
MKLLILSIAFLGALLAPTLATNNISERNQGNVGGRAHQSVSIDNQKQVVNVDNNNGWNSWNTVWDYKNGYVATRVLSKKSCILSRMNPEVMPDVTTLPDAIRIKQKDRTKGPAHKEVTYVVSSKRITDLAPYGKNIQALCRGIPTFPAYEAKGRSFAYFSESCWQADVLFLLGISYCGESFQY